MELEELVRQCLEGQFFLRDTFCARGGTGTNVPASHRSPDRDIARALVRPVAAGSGDRPGDGNRRTSAGCCKTVSDNGRFRLPLVHPGE